MHPKKRLLLFVASFILTLVVLRVSLFFFPRANLYLFGYNIHHFFTGSLLVIVCTLFFLFEIITPVVIVGMGTGSAFVIDETVYLIATDGSDGSYFSRVSVVGMIILALIVITAVMLIYRHRKSNS